MMFHDTHPYSDLSTFCWIMFEEQVFPNWWPTVCVRYVSQFTTY